MSQSLSLVTYSSRRPGVDSQHPHGNLLLGQSHAGSLIVDSVSSVRRPGTLLWSLRVLDAETYMQAKHHTYEINE